MLDFPLWRRVFLWGVTLFFALAAVPSLVSLTGGSLPAALPAPMVDLTALTRTPWAISISAYWSSTLITLPSRPPAVTTWSPFLTAAILVWWSFWRFICGRISRNQKMATMPTIGSIEIQNGGSAAAVPAARKSSMVTAYQNARTAGISEVARPFATAPLRCGGPASSKAQ